MISAEAFLDAPVLPALRLTADRDRWLSNRLPVESYAIAIGRVTLDDQTRQLVDGLDGPMGRIGAVNVKQPCNPERPNWGGILEALSLTPDKYKSAIAEPFDAVNDLG